MIRSILVPLDGSALAERALPTAAALAARLGARLHLVTVHPPSALPLPAEDPLGELTTLDRQSREAEREYLRQQAREAAERHAVAATEALLQGEPAAELARYAAEHEIDLVVMTTHGRGGFSRFWLGSVADRLLRRLERPVLLLRGDGGASPGLELVERVLVPLDGSRLAETALDFSRRLLASDGARLQLVMVVEPPFLFAPPPPPGAAERFDAAPLQRRQLLAYRYLRRLARAAEADGIPAAVEAVVGQDPARALVSYAEERRVSLIVMASRGRGGLERLVLGSVADKVIRSAGVPVLVCRPAHAESGLSPEFLAALEEPDPAEHGAR